MFLLPFEANFRRTVGFNRRGGFVTDGERCRRDGVFKPIRAGHKDCMSQSVIQG